MRSSDLTRRALFGGLLASSSMAAAQRAMPWRAPSFRAGFQFLSGTAVASVFTMSQLAMQPNGTLQRSTFTGGGQGKGQASTQVALNVSTAGTLFARCRSVSDGATVVQAPWQVSNNVGTGSQTVTVSGIDVPAIKSDAQTPNATADGLRFLDLSGDGQTWTNGTVPFQIGDVGVWWGQSLLTYMASRLGTDTTTLSQAGVTPSAYGRALGSNSIYSPGVGSLNWEIPAETDSTHHWNSAGVAEYLRCMVASLGCAQAIVHTGVSGTALSTWQSGQANMNTLLANMSRAGLTSTGITGGFRFGFSLIGHSDSQAASTASYVQNALANSWSTIQAQNTFAGTKIVTVSAIPYVADNGTTAGDVFQVATVRRGTKNYADANGFGYLQTEDIVTGDGTHEKMVGAVTLARDLYRSYKPALGIGTGNTGAVVSGTITRSGATITVPFSRPLATQVGSFANRVWITDSGNILRPRKVSSVSVSGSTLTVTLASDPGAGWAGDLYLYLEGWTQAGATYDGSVNMVYDTLIEADETALGFTKGRALQPTLDTPLAVPAVTSGGAVAALPAYNMAVASALTYAAGAANFGQEITNGSASTGGLAYSGLIPAPATRAMGAFITLPSAPSGNVVAVGFASGDWLGFNASGNLLLSGTALSATNYAGAGRLWVVITQTATTRTVYVNGTQISSVANVGRFFYGGAGARATGFGGFGNLGVSNVDEIVGFASIPTGFTAVPTSPFAGTEANCTYLYHNDNAVTDSATAMK